MNQIQYTTAKKHCLFVMLPEQWKVHSVTKEAFEGNNILCLKHPIIRGFKMINIPNGYDWQLQGFVSQLTDEQKEWIVDISVNDPEYVFNYKSGWFEEGLSYSESFASLLTSLNVLLVNPYGKSPCQPKYRGYCEDYCQGDCWTNSNIDYDDWQTAQQHVGNWILLTFDK